MFSCLSCKPAVKERDNEEENEQHRQDANHPTRPKESTNNITKKLKGIALKVTGSKRQSKELISNRVLSSTSRLPLESEIETETKSEHNVPSYVGGGSPTAEWNISGAAYEENSTFDGFDAIPVPIAPRPSLVTIDARADEEVVEGDLHAPKWVALVEEGISIFFGSLPDGGNDLTKIRFNQEMFSRDLAQRWWVRNNERIKEFYNIQSINGEPFVPPTLGPSQTEWGKQQGESSSHSSRLAFGGGGGGGSAMEANGGGPSVTLTPSNSFRMEPSTEAEWVEQDEAGVFITIRSNVDGVREICCIRFRTKFQEDDAKNWWLQNKERVETQYL